MPNKTDSCEETMRKKIMQNHAATRNFKEQGNMERSETTYILFNI